MKKSIINLCFLLLGIQGYAAIRTVSNNSSTLVQYSSMQATVDANSFNF